MDTAELTKGKNNMSNRNYNTQTNPNRQKLMNGGRAKKMGGGMMKRPMMEKGGSLKAVPADNKGLKKLPTEVRNKMGFMKKGGMVPNKKYIKKVAKELRR